jgi:hypothetical protein
MSGRHGHRLPDDRDPQVVTNNEADSTVTAIAGLRWRLRRQELLEHPKVLSALRKFHTQIEDQLTAADQNPGRHRSSAGSTAGQQINDAFGFDQKPDPLTATTPAEFVKALIIGCGGDEEDLKAYASAWRRIGSLIPTS